MLRPRAAAYALAASLSVYLIPLIGPHAAWFLGEALFQGEAGKSAHWIAVNLAVALVVQLLAFGLFCWFFGKPGWRRAVPLLIAFPVVVLVLQWVYLVRIPTAFLEEPDVAAENISWPLVCTAPDVYLTNLGTRSELWVRSVNQPSNYAVLTMPGCRLATITLPQPKFTPGGRVDFMIDVTSVIPEGRAVVQKRETSSGKMSWWMIPGARTESDPSLLPLVPPAGYTGNSPPVLSNDGGWAAWVEVIPDTGPPVLNRVVLRPLDPREKERAVDLSGLGPAIYFLKSVDLKSEELDFWKTDRLIAVGLDGRLKKEFAKPGAVHAQQNTYLEMGNDWLAWDAYREDGPYSLEWVLPSGTGSNRVPLGRTIHSAAFDASGKWVAVSVGTALNIGKARDAVYVLNASDGREVFRKYLPPFSRSPVAFLDRGFFAYSDRGGVRLLRVPD